MKIRRFNSLPNGGFDFSKYEGLPSDHICAPILEFKQLRSSTDLEGASLVNNSNMAIAVDHSLSKLPKLPGLLEQVGMEHPHACIASSPPIHRQRTFELPKTIHSGRPLISSKPFTSSKPIKETSVLSSDSSSDEEEEEEEERDHRKPNRSYRKKGIPSWNAHSNLMDRRYHTTLSLIQHPKTGKSHGKANFTNDFRRSKSQTIFGYNPGSLDLIIASAFESTLGNTKSKIWNTPNAKANKPLVKDQGDLLETRKHRTSMWTMSGGESHTMENMDKDMFDSSPQKMFSRKNALHKFDRKIRNSPLAGKRMSENVSGSFIPSSPTSSASSRPRRATIAALHMDRNITRSRFKHKGEVRKDSII